MSNTVCTKWSSPLAIPFLSPQPSASAGQLAAEHCVYAAFIKTGLTLQALAYCSRLGVMQCANKYVLRL